MSIILNLTRGTKNRYLIIYKENPCLFRLLPDFFLLNEDSHRLKSLLATTIGKHIILVLYINMKVLIFKSNVLDYFKKCGQGIN